MFRRRHRIALIASLTVHVCLIILFFSIIHLLKSKAEHDPQVNTRVGEADDSTVVCLHVDYAESLPPAPQPKTSATPAKLPKAVKQAEPAASTNSVQQASSQAADSGPPEAAPPGKPGVGPLHGKISQEGYMVVYVLDRSGSMGRAGKLSKARDLLKASLHQLSPQVRFQIVAYDSEAEAFNIDQGIELACATSENIRRAEEQLEQLIAEGSSKHLEGFRLGLRFRPNLLILLSDADDLSLADAKLVKQWNPKNETSIHAVILGSPDSTRGVSALQTVCQQGDGIHFLP
jgi:hypothetical protein